MANAFSKEEKVQFERILEGFEDALVSSKEVKVAPVDSVSMARSNDVVWRPMPYIAQSYNGLDQSSNFNDSTQLSVPATLGFTKSSPWLMDSKELRDALQENRLGDAAKQKLASDIELAVLSTLSNQATLVVDVSTAAGDYDDVALCDSIMNEQGVPNMDRCLALSSRSYNGLAGNLAVASRSFNNPKSVNAYERSFVGDVAGFKTFKLQHSNRIAAAAGSGLTIDTQAAATNYLVPAATSTAATGEVSNVDNRTQQITISATTNVAAGDCFTIAGVEAVHHITKQSTGQLKTFRVISVDSGTTMTISPGIISNQGGSDAEAQYQNVSVTESATAAITFLNTTAADINPFWVKGSVELLPGRLAVPTDSGASVMRATTANGIEVVWQKQFDINTSKTKYRLDTFFGVVNLNPEQNGILLFGQA